MNTTPDLKRIAVLARRVQTGLTEDTPEPLKKSPALRALYDNLKKPTGRKKSESIDTIRVFAISKLGWIKQQNENFGSRNVNPRASISTAKVTMSGASVMLMVTESEEPPLVALKHSKLHLRVRPGSDGEKSRLSMRRGIETNSGSPVIDCKLGTGHAGESGKVFRAANEDQVRQLQSGQQGHPAQHRTCEETTRMPRIHRRS
jgi:hypothetical protein